MVFTVTHANKQTVAMGLNITDVAILPFRHVRNSVTVQILSAKAVAVIDDRPLVSRTWRWGRVAVQFYITRVHCLNNTIRSIVPIAVFSENRLI
jgi:hypothetical protein